MKLQISFDMVDLEQALEVAKHVAPYADILELGTPLIYRNGIVAVEKFKNAFPDIALLADTKIVDRGRDIVSLFAKAGANWLTVMAGTNKNVIHAACTAAGELNIKIMIDLLDSSSLAQSALEAKNLGASALLFHQPFDEQEALVVMDKWDMITGNASLPIYASGRIDKSTIANFLAMKPYGLVIGKSITETAQPAQQAEFFHKLCTEGS